VRTDEARSQKLECRVQRFCLLASSFCLLPSSSLLRRLRPHFCILASSFCLLTSFACSPSSQLLRLSGPRPLPVETAHYPFFTATPAPDDQVLKRAEAWKQDIEQNERVLRQLVRDRYDTKSPLEFRFMYVAVDTANRRAVVRYFAREADQTSWVAGYEVFLGYSLPSGRLEQAWVNRLPLE